MSYWDDVRDILYDAINEEFYTEEEREEKIEEAFSIFAGYTDDPTDIPLQFTRRRQSFWSPIDLITWIEESGVGPEYIWIRRFKDGDEYKYQAFID